MDDANQPVPNPTAPNLQVSIVPQAGTAYSGARLLSGSVSGSSLQVATSGGVGLFALSSGSDSGVILLRLVSDRYDNNVSNGIQDAVDAVLAVPVVDKIAGTVDPLAFTPPTDVKATNGISFSYALTASGGVPPYSWAAAGALPSGLSLSSSGIISGTPQTPAGTYTVAVTVTDSAGTSATGNLNIEISGDMATAPLAITGCSATDGNTPCPLPQATKNQTNDYAYVLSVTGGDATQAASWSLVNPVTGVTIGQSTGLLTVARTELTSCRTIDVYVSVKRGTAEIIRRLQVPVVAGPGLGGSC